MERTGEVGLIDFLKVGQLLQRDIVRPPAVADAHGLRREQALQRRYEHVGAHQFDLAPQQRCGRAERHLVLLGPQDDEPMRFGPELAVLILVADFAFEFELAIPAHGAFDLAIGAKLQDAFVVLDGAFARDLERLRRGLIRRRNGQRASDFDLTGDVVLRVLVERFRQAMGVVLLRPGVAR